MRPSISAVVPVVLAAVGLSSALPAAAVPASTTSARTAVELPSAPVDVKLAGTFAGVDLSWQPPADAVEDEVSGYVIHRVVGGADTAIPWVPDWNSNKFEWRESERIPGATYAVAAVNADGEGPASTPVAAPPTRDAITVGHTVWLENGNTRTFAGQVAIPGGTQVVPLSPDGPTQVIGSAIAVSPDGRGIVFAKGQLSLWRIRADVPHAQPVQILDGSSGIIRMAWSPDGSRIAFERLQPDSSSCVEVIAATGGTPIRVGCNILMPAWMPDSQALIVKNGFSGLLQQVQAKAGGAVLGNWAGTEQSSYPTASPDGRWIAYISNKAPAVIPIGGGTPKVGTPWELTPAAIAWSPDGTKLLVTQSVQYGGGALTSHPVGADGTPGAGDIIFSRPSGERIGSAVWQGGRVVISPMPTIQGSELRITLDTSAVPASASITCQLDESPATACASPYSKSGVAAGKHVLRVKSVEPDGRTTVAARSFTVDTTAPVPSITGPGFDATTASTATVTYTATDSGSGAYLYDVRWRIAPTAGNFGAYAPVKSSIPSTSVLISMAPGYEYCVSVRARDRTGNLSGWTADRCFSRPSDDRAMGATKGWVRASHRLYYLGTATSTSATNISVSRSSVQAKRLFLVATRCSTCGSLTVYYNGKSAGIVNLAYPSTVYQAIVPLPTPTTFLTGSVLLTTRVAGKVYQIDGLAVRRT